MADVPDAGSLSTAQKSEVKVRRYGSSSSNKIILTSEKTLFYNTQVCVLLLMLSMHCERHM